MHVCAYMCDSHNLADHSIVRFQSGEEETEQLPVVQKPQVVYHLWKSANKPINQPRNWSVNQPVYNLSIILLANQ